MSQVGSIIAALALGTAPPGALDGGSSLAFASAEDREVIENMELLESLDESANLELLLVLSETDSDAGSR